MNAKPGSSGTNWRDLFYTSQDGLRLYGREYGSRQAPLTPVVCLSGLSRNSKDFHELAATLAQERRVLALDYRGRGRSEYAADPSTYTPMTELLDTLAAMEAAAIEHAVIIGTSRGGIIAMMMGTACPAAIRGVVLNDVGPRIEPEGLLRIAEHLTNTPSPESWSHAAAIVKQNNETSFTDLTPADWDAFARRTYRDEGGVPVSDFDPALSRLLSENLAISDGRVPEMWSQFDSLRKFPTLAIRGENSDILTSPVLTRMSETNPGLRMLTLPNRGHAPFLTEPDAVSEVRRILARADVESTLDDSA